MFIIVADLVVAEISPVEVIHSSKYRVVFVYITRKTSWSLEDKKNCPVGINEVFLLLSKRSSMNFYSLCLVPGFDCGNKTTFGISIQFRLFWNLAATIQDEFQFSSFCAGRYSCSQYVQDDSELFTNACQCWASSVVGVLPRLESWDVPSKVNNKKKKKRSNDFQYCVIQQCLKWLFF